MTRYEDCGCGPKEENDEGRERYNQPHEEPCKKEHLYDELGESVTYLPGR